jgi:hypothetical protein
MVVLTWVGDFPSIVRLATIYDPAAFWAANLGSSLFFDPKRIAPGNGEIQIFELILVTAFAIECLVLGYLVQWSLSVAKRAV